MASLYNNKISTTYVGLIKTVDNAVINASLKELTDGSGNASGLYVNTAGDFKVTSILEWGSLKDTGEGITITKFVDEADGIASNDNDTTIPTSAAVVDYVASRITLEDLDFSGDSGTGSVDLDSQTFAVVGTANEIETSAGSQQLQIGLPTNIVIAGTTTFGGNLIGNTNIILKDTSDNTLAAFYSGGKGEIYFNDSKKFETTSDGATVTGGLTATGSSVFTTASFSGTITGDLTGDVTGDLTGDVTGDLTGDVTGNVTGNLTGDVTGDVTGNLTGNVTGNLTGDSTGNVTATSVLADGVTATTQSASNNSTKVATTAYVDSQAALSDTLSEVLAIGNTTGATKISVDNTSSGVDFIDNAKAIFGTSQDGLEIYHNGSDSYIKDTGTGDLIIDASFIDLTIGGNNAIKLHDNGTVYLYNSNNQKFQTTATGIAVTGGITTDGASTFSSSLDVTGIITADGGLNLNDNDKIKVGNSGDLEIYHDGADSFISDTGSGNLVIQASDKIEFKAINGENLLRLNENGDVSLWYNNAEKLATTSTGVNVSGVTDTDGITSSAEIDVDLASEGKYFEGGSGSVRRLSITSGTNTSAHALHTFNIDSTNGKYKFDIDGTEEFSVDASNASLGGNLTIAGDLTVNGTTTTVNTDHFNVEDPLISMAKDNAANTVDIGFYGRYNDGTQRYLGLFSDASDANRYKLFKGLTVEPTTTVDTSATGYEYADILLASLESRGSITIKQQDDAGFDGGLIITRSANTQKLVVGLDGGAINFNSPDSLTYKFRANGTEKASIDSNGSATFAGDVTLDDDLNFSTDGYADISNTGTGSMRFKPTSETLALTLTGANATFAGNVTFGDSHFIGDDGDDNLLIQSSASENIILDSADDIVLDAGGDDIKLKVGGTEYGKFNNDSSNLNIFSSIQDKDIVFRGDDGGSIITAFTLDMSDGGAAEFGNRVYVPDYIAHVGNSDTLFGFSGTDTFIVNTDGSTALTIDSTQNVIFAQDATIGGKTYPKLNLLDNQGVARNFSIGTNNETFTLRNETGSADVLTIAGADNLVTIAGTIDVGTRQGLKPSEFGYSSTYKTLIVGSAGTTYGTDATTLCFNVDVSGNSSGSYTGAGAEYMFRNVGAFTSPNAANDGYNTILEWDSSGNPTTAGTVMINKPSTASMVIGLNMNNAANEAGNGRGVGINFQTTTSSDRAVIIGSESESNYATVNAFVVRTSNSAAPTERFRVTGAGTIHNPNSQGSTWFGLDAGLSQIGTVGTYNTLYGNYAGRLITTGTRNTILGALAGDAAGTNTLNYNVIIGSYAGSALANTSNSNVLVGDGAGASSTGMSSSVIIGQGAGDGNTGSSNVLIGYNAAPVNTSGQRNVAIGTEALRYNITGIDVVAIGYRALYTDASIEESTAVGSHALYSQSDGRNTAIGYHALMDLTTGTYNTAVGGETLENLTDAAYNVGVGTFALRALTEGDENTAVGYQALANNTTQSKLTAVGHRAGYFWTGGNENTFIGHHAGYGTAAGSTGGENTMIGSLTGASSAGIGGDGNTSLGRYTLFALSSGSYNTAIGHQAGAGISTGDANTVVGKNAGNVIAGGSRNSILGQSAGIKITSGADNVAIGYEALYNVSTTGMNVAIGVNALYTYTGSRTVAIGYGAAKLLSSDVDNVFIGQQCGENRTGGVDNTFVGSYANYSGTSTGAGNTGFGKSTGYSLTSAAQCTFVGRQAGYSCATNGNNTMMGHNAGLYGTGGENTIVGSQAGSKAGFTGNNNTIMGYSAGDEITSGGQNLVLGYAAGSGSSPFQLTTEAYRIILGDNSSTDAYIKIDWTVTSDKRDKTDFKEIEHGLDFVNKLKPTEYKFRKNRDTEETDGKRRYGFIAQDILELEGDDSVIIDTEQEDDLKYKQSHLVPVLVKAIQELKAEVETLKQNCNCK